MVRSPAKQCLHFTLDQLWWTEQQENVSTPCGSHDHKGDENTGSHIGSPENDYSLLKMRHGCFLEYTLEYGYTPTHCNVVSHLIHDGNNLLRL